MNHFQGDLVHPAGSWGLINILVAGRNLFSYVGLILAKPDLLWANYSFLAAKAASKLIRILMCPTTGRGLYGTPGLTVYSLPMFFWTHSFLMSCSTLPQELGSFAFQSKTILHLFVERKTISLWKATEEYGSFSGALL